MNTTAESIKAFAAGLPEGVIISAKELLHLEERAAVDQALSRLVKSSMLAILGRSTPASRTNGFRASEIKI